MVNAKRHRIPYELLAEIVKLALRRQLDSEQIDAAISERGANNGALIPVAQKSSLQTMSGMLLSCKLFREVVLMEWFRMLRVSANDWDYFTRTFQFDVFSGVQ